MKAIVYQDICKKFKGNAQLAVDHQLSNTIPGFRQRFCYGTEGPGRMGAITNTNGGGGEGVEVFR